MSEAMMWLLLRGVWETLAMTFVSGFFQNSIIKIQPAQFPVLRIGAAGVCSI